MSKDIYIVYETTNLKNGKYYIGVHKKNGRNYFGSGKILGFAIKKYGSENFMREILRKFSNEKDAYDFEKLIVGDKLIESDNCYNICEGGICSPMNGHDVLRGKHNDCIEMYKNGKSLKLIAEYFNVGDITVYRSLLKDKKCKKLLKYNNTKNKRILNDSQIKEVIKMNKNGFSFRKIGRQFNVSHKTISKYINNLGGK